MSPASVGDGNINMGDMALFSSAFGEGYGDGGWNDEVDFGPTDNWSRLGIPLPDNEIDFEDLMIFSMNYGNVSPTTAPLILADEPINVLRDKVSFRLVATSTEGVFSIVMENTAKTLKGVSLTLDYGAGNQLVAVDPSGRLVSSQSFLGTIDRGSGKVEICVAALGVNRPLVVTGEIAQIEVRPANGAPAGVTLAKTNLRNLANERDEVAHDIGHTSDVPMASGLMQNHPNPFNPTTMLTYDVATPGHVTIEIFDVTGRRIRTLVNEDKGAGRFDAMWDARDDNGTPVHSGIYFYRMKARGYTSPAKKMVLLK